ncbi:MAG: hypothetical protein R6W91_04515 [Thermoplasmata archaeon]
MKLMRDFTLEKYSELMLALMGNYRIMTVGDYLSMFAIGKNTAVLLHDVDKLPERAARMALLEKRLGLRSTYYFRWDPKAVYWAGTGEDRYGNFPELQVVEAKLHGHEVGYTPLKGEDPAPRLARLRALAPVRTAYSEAVRTAYSEAPDVLGGPHSPEFGEFARFTDSKRGWRADGAQEKLKGTDSLIEILKAGKYPLVMVDAHPGLWREPRKR